MSGGGSTDYVAGYRYLFGIHMGVCRGPIDELVEIRVGDRTAWVIDEIGKERPITIGVVVADGRIESVDVLAFRESRGGEVRYPFFTKQYKNLGLKDGDRLDGHVDGITGATLSVWAVTKVSRLALVLHSEVIRND